MGGYVGIDGQGGAKPMSVGNLFRCAHAFGPGFAFTLDAQDGRSEAESGTSEAPGQVPLYGFPDAESMNPPRDWTLVGTDLPGEAVDLPSFRHPRSAVHVLGPEHAFGEPIRRTPATEKER